MGKIIIAHFLAFPDMELNIFEGEYKEGNNLEIIDNLQMMPIEFIRYEELQCESVITFQQAWDWLDKRVCKKKQSRIYRAYALLTYIMNAYAYQQFSCAIIAIESLIIPEGMKCRAKGEKIANRLKMILQLKDNSFFEDILRIYKKRNQVFHEGIGIVDYYSDDVYLSENLTDKTIAILVYLFGVLIKNDASGFDFEKEAEGIYTFGV